MTKVVDGTKVRHHGLFYMENAGGYGDEPETPKSAATDDRQPGCFALEEERGEDWKGSGAMKSEINESRPITVALVYFGLWRPFQSLKFNGLANAIRLFVRLKAVERCPCFIG